MSAGKEIYRFRFGQDASGAYVGELVDDWGWVIAIRAEMVKREGVKVFGVTGTLTGTPGHHARIDRPPPPVIVAAEQRG